MRNITISFLLLLTVLSFGQAPQSINYQGAARQTGGSVLSNTTISVVIELYDAPSGGTLKFTETHPSVSTNEYGLFNIKIGSVNTTVFPTINWSTGNYYVQTTVTYAGSTSVLSPRQQLSSVPYALYAGSDWSSASGTIYPKNITDKVAIGTLTTTASRFGVTESSSSVPTASITQLDPNGTALDVGVAGFANLTGYAAIFRGRVSNQNFTQLGSTNYPLLGYPELCPNMFVIEVDSARQAMASSLFPTAPKLIALPAPPFTFYIGAVVSGLTSPKKISRKEIIGVQMFIETTMSGFRTSIPPNTTTPPGYEYYYNIADDPSGYAIINIFSTMSNSANVLNKYIRVVITIKQP